MALLKNLSACRKQGQSVILLGAFLLVPVSAFIFSTVISTTDTAASNTAVIASTSAATAAGRAGIGPSNIGEDSVTTAACQAMDQFLPAQIISIGATPAGVVVIVAAPSRTGGSVSHGFAAAWFQDSRLGQPTTDRRFVFQLTGAELAALNPACVGRAS